MMEEISIKPYIPIEKLEEIFKSSDKTKLFYEIIRPKLQDLVTPILNTIEDIIGVDIFWHSKLSVVPSIHEENANFVGYGIEPRKNESYQKNSDLLKIFLRFEIHSPEESGVYFGIKGKYEKSRFAFLFHQHPEDVVNVIQNAFVYVKLQEKQVDLTTTEKVINFLDQYFTEVDEVTFFGPVEITRAKEEVSAGSILRFLTLFPIYQAMIEYSLSYESNFKNYIKRVFSFLQSP
ncbi:MAG: hypothetical protein ABDH37_00150 [Candidatus Hydrothermales bacterium]